MPDHTDLYALAKSPGARPSHQASFLLMLHEQLLRNITNQALNDVMGQDAVYTAWASWTGMTFHNLPYIASAVADADDAAFLRKECMDFVEYASREPVPAHWHPTHPDYDRGIGHIWKSICDFIADVLEVEPVYGVPAISPVTRIPPLPVIPHMGFADKFLPAPLKTFLAEYKEVLKTMPSGSFTSSRWTHWTPEGAEDVAADTNEADS